MIIGRCPPISSVGTIECVYGLQGIDDLVVVEVETSVANLYLWKKAIWGLTREGYEGSDYHCVSFPAHPVKPLRSYELLVSIPWSHAKK